MRIKEKVFYWGPFLTPIATSKAIVNSAKALQNYGKNYESSIINFFGEFDNYRNEIEKNNIKLISNYKFRFSRYLPYYGKLKSRFSFIMFFIFGFFPLKKIIKQNNPEFLIIHLITSLPLILLLLFNFKTKFILRISGMPKMNFIRKNLWKLALKKIYIVTCPTNNTLKYLKKLNIVNENKLRLLYDPVLNVKKIQKEKKEKIYLKDYFLSVGRLSKQKNFIFLCQAFQQVIKTYKNYKLIIAGEGEEKKQLEDFITKNNLQKNIFLIGHKKNIFPYFKNSKGFILSSLWEDPGFVIVESFFCKIPILTSNSWPGPVELVNDLKNGFVFENNNISSFLQKFKDMDNNKNIRPFILNGLKVSKKFTLFNHYKNLDKILSLN
jgi:glycosyltransferase involved in cell wall biosynthesis